MLGEGGGYWCSNAVTSYRKAVCVGGGRGDTGVVMR